MNRRFALLLLLAIAIAPARAQAPANRLSGDVVALDGGTLHLRLGTGKSVAVTMAADARISGRAAAEVSDIAPGTFVAVTAVPQADGTLLASEVRIFPPSMRGVGEGHRPMTSMPGSTMTNATVASVDTARRGGDATTTSGSVAALAGSGAMPTMTLKYHGGEKVVTIPPGATIAKLEDGDRALLVPGAHVVVSVTHRPDETLVTNRVTVGLRGLVPPS